MSPTIRELDARVKEIQKELGNFDELRTADKLQQDQINTLTGAADRLSLAVLGDEQLGVKGLVKTVEELKEQSMSTKLAKAKWAGAGIVLIGLTKGIWALAEVLLAK